MSFIAALKSFCKNFPVVKRLVAERDRLAAELDALVKAHGMAPPGHFYSPIVSVAEIARNESRVFGQTARSVPGIDLREVEQVELMVEFEKYYNTMCFSSEKQEGSRYYFENPAYSYSDAIILHCMIRHVRPKIIVEVGSGFSSCAILDTNEAFFDDSIKTIFIEPYPKLLESLITTEDKQRVTILPIRLQDVNLDVFAQLRKNDILFVDSTHVSKTGSDVNRLFFEVLPALESGVYIHIHDVFYPFEYPKSWVLGGRSWNELYMLRAFIQYNSEFEIVFMNTFLEHFHEELFRERMPLCLKNRGGSIWLRRR